MDSLQQIYKQKGQEFLDNLLSNELTVVEKINTSLLSFKKVKDRDFSFYKGNGQKDGSEINLIDETGSTFYKNGIEFINNFSDIVKDKCPKGWTFVFLYFPSKKTSFIEYENIPKNGLSLKSIFTDNNTCIDDSETLESWANTFNTDYVKPIFQGFLNTYQKEEINKYISGKSSNIGCFSKYIIKLLNIDITTSTYQNDYNSIIDSFIFSFKTNNGMKKISAKLVDPMMIDLITKNKCSYEHDSTDIALADFALFVDKLDFDNYTVHGETKEEKYVSILCKLFNDYVKNKKAQLKDFEPDSNKIVKESIDSKFSVDLDKIKNETTKRILRENDSLKKVFRALLGAFTKPFDEKYQSILITPNIVRVINNVVAKIDKKSDDEGINENDAVPFMTFMNHFNNGETNNGIKQTDNIPSGGNEAIARDIIGDKFDIIVKSFDEFKKESDKESKLQKNEIKSISDSIKELKDKLDELSKNTNDVKNDTDSVDKKTEKMEKDIDNVFNELDKIDDKKSSKDEEKEDKKEDKKEKGDDNKKTNSKNNNSEENKNTKDGENSKNKDEKK